MADIYDIDTYQPRKGVGYLLNRVRSELLAALDEALRSDPELASLEISSAQFIVVAALALSDTANSSSDLCKGISYDAGAMTRMIDRLESKGLLRRNRRPDDRRVVYVELTEEGHRAFPRMRLVAMGVVNRFLRGFSQAEARQLESYLSRMLENAA
ncbi:MAG TPA: MarR family transcriptional regulator [Steroidobacteraceae bacterium]|nr:MarR family transcriptional regulator [Steroidobacteraceae bacterium]